MVPRQIENQLPGEGYADPRYTHLCQSEGTASSLCENSWPTSMARRSIVLEVLLVGLLALMASVTLIVNHPHFLPSQGSIKEILDQDVLWNGLKSNGCQEKPVWLNKRAVSGVPDVPTAEWCGNVEKGQKFMTYSTNGYPQSAPPPYDAALNGQLSTQGWQTSSPTPPSLSPFSQAFRVLGLAGRFPPNVNVQLDQSLPYTPSDGTEHPATGAVYGNIFDPTHGTIIAYNNFSPGYQLSKLYPNAGQRPPPPQLNRWSDVVFLEWARLATAKQLTGLQFILRVSTSPSILPEHRRPVRCN